MSQELLGGCVCGTVRYRVGPVLDASICHCKVCKRLGGGAFLPWALVAPEGFAVTAGAPASFAADIHGVHYFCGRCGSRLYAIDDGQVAVCVGTLDDPDAVAPRIHIAVEQQARWLKINDLLHRTEGTTPTPPAERNNWRGPADPAVSRDSPLSLREIDGKNVRAMLLLDTTGPQRRFVAPNAVSLAQAAFHEQSRTPWVRGIYAGDTAVGLMMINVEDEDIEGLQLIGEPFLWRLMIDERYQGLGFGARALALATDEVRSWGAPRAFWVSMVEGTGGARAFYRKMGFVETGAQIEGEWILRRPLR